MQVEKCLVGISCLPLPCVLYLKLTAFYLNQSVPTEAQEAPWTCPQDARGHFEQKNPSLFLPGKLGPSVQQQNSKSACTAQKTSGKSVGTSGDSP